MYRQIANFEAVADLKNGDVWHKPHTSVPTPKAYTRGTAVTIQDVTVTDESLTVDQDFVSPFYVDDLDALQSNYPLMNRLADEAGIKISNKIDGDVLGEYDQATTTLDDDDITGGTDGNGFVLTTSNVQTVFAAAKRALQRLNVTFAAGQLFAVISPHFEEILLRYLAGKESILGDKTGVAGHIGQYYGFDLFSSNSTGWSAELGMATNPTEADTVVIDGVTFTFNATPSGAGSVDIGGSAAVSVDNLVAAINDSGTAGTTYIQLTDANRAKMDKITATDGTTTMTLKGEGVGYAAVSETLTASADVWTAGKEQQHCLFGKKGATHAVVQVQPTMKVKDVPDKLGVNVIPYTLYGLKTFDAGDDELVNVVLDSSGASFT